VECIALTENDFGYNMFMTVDFDSRTLSDIRYRYLAVLVSLVYLCDDTADEPLHVVRVVDEVWRAVESDGVGHLGQGQFSIILAFVIVCIVVLNDVVVNSGVVLLEFFHLQFTSLWGP